MNDNKTNINWYPGHMAKTKREIKEKLSLIDVIYEVIDARMPVSSKIVDLDELVLNKPRILIMTKYDMCDKEETDKFVKSYRENGNVVITTNLLNGVNIKQILEETNKISDKISKDRKSKGLKPRNIRALVVGVPNCGKSTLINKLVGKKATIVGDKPGVTKSLSWIRIGKNIELLDSPGILWPKLENQIHAHNLAALSSIKEEIIDIENLSIYVLNFMNDFYFDNLSKRYGISKKEEDVLLYVDFIGKKRGALIKGGEVDYDKVYKIIIRDLKDGNLGKVTFDRFQ